MQIPRYSQIYLEKQTRLTDSPKMRKRITSYYKKLSVDYYSHQISALIETKVGIDVPLKCIDYLNVPFIENLLEKTEIKDFLDILSIIAFAIDAQRDSEKLKSWIDAIEEVFREEGMAYTIDETGLVKPYVDEEFSQNYHASLSALENSRYDNARTVFENAHKNLRADRPDTRVAVKDIFESIEIVAKLLDSKITALGQNEVDKNLWKVCESIFDDQHEKNFIKSMLSSLAKWVTAHHPYRHGQGKEEYAPLSLESAILSLSTGSSFLRFLIYVDQKQLETVASP